MENDAIDKQIEEELNQMYQKYGDRMLTPYDKFFIEKRIKDKSRRYDLICRIENSKLEELCKMINNLTIKDEKTIKEKGNKLEEIVEFIFSNLSLFKVLYTNKRNSTNEMDLVVELDNEGKLASFERLFPFKEVDLFIIECKNYDKKVDVTWLGKFYSLLRSCNLNFGLIFSIDGFTKGRGSWQGAKGLSKKLILKDDTYILDVNMNHLKQIARGENFIELIKNEKTILDLDLKHEFKDIVDHDYQEEITDAVSNL